jgi:hypothetical protein
MERMTTGKFRHVPVIEDGRLAGIISIGDVVKHRLAEMASESSAMAAALVLVTLMTIQGLGFLTPVNVFVCMELQKANPNMKKIAAWMQRYFYVVAMQGIMQVAMIVVMTRFRSGI